MVCDGGKVEKKEIGWSGVFNHSNLIAITKMERRGVKIKTNVILLMIMVNILPGVFTQVLFHFALSVIKVETLYDVGLLFFDCNKRLENLNLLNHRTRTFVLKTVSSTDIL